MLVQQAAHLVSAGSSRIRPQIHRLSVWAVAAALVIGLVSAYDIYLTIVYWATLPELELNPVGRRILFPDGPEADLRFRLGLFIGMKCAGTMLVMSILQLLAAFHYRHTIPIICGVTSSQILLLAFLALGDGSAPH